MSGNIYMLLNVFKNVHIWLPSYLFNMLFKTLNPNKRKIEEPIHILFCICNHFEPYRGQGYEKQGIIKIENWVKVYPKVAKKHRDADGYLPRHTFFYPAEQYRPEYLDLLAKLCHDGYAEVEIHLHHDSDTPENLRKTLIEFKEILASRHGLLSRDKHTGEIKYGFIHGNWALDNSRKDGRWCGVNNELQILRETGCYADFTLPSAPNDTQTRKINSIYYAIDDPNKPKSHNTGIDVEVGKEPLGDLMIIQGPLTLNWGNRKYGILPRIENSEIRVNNPPTIDRIDLWIKQHICVKGRPEWIFIKVHCHGTQEKNMSFLLNEGLERMFSYLEQKYNDGKKYFLHYVTAREMYNIIKAAEAGYQGKPGDFRNFQLIRMS